MQAAGERFYDRSIADRLVDSTYFNAEIFEYLRAESNLLNSCAANFDVLVEVGSMHGRHLEWAVGMEKTYLGIDLIERYIAAGQDTIERRGLDPIKFRFVRGAAERLDEILGSYQLSASSRTLLFFPFNSIGNMENLNGIAMAIRRCECPFLICSYQTTLEATTGRELYYRNCGYHDLRQYRNKHGVLFVAADGLRTVAYHPSHFIRVFARQNLSVIGTKLGAIGMAFLTPALHPPTSTDA